MDVCYATNSKYVDLMLVSILSLEKYNSKCKFHVLHIDLQPKDIKKIDGISKSEIKYYKVNEESLNSVIDNMDFQNFHFSVEAFFRLLIPKYINLDKVLYMDVDTMVRGHLEDLYNIDLTGKPIAAVNWYEIQSKKLASLKMLNKPIYFNSGVMLMNLSYFRNYYPISDLLSKFATNPKKYPLVDQDILNESINGSHYVLEESFNYTGSTTKKMKFKNSIKIVHFAGKIKPFYKYIPHPYKHEFVRYWTSKEINNELIFNREYLVETLKNKFRLKKIIGQIDFLRKIKWKIFKEDKKWLRKEY